MDCPYVSITWCQCPKTGMIEGVDATYYPSAGFLRIGRQLYNTRTLQALGEGHHFWEAVVKCQPILHAARSVYMCRHYRLYYLTLSVMFSFGSLAANGLRTGSSTPMTSWDHRRIRLTVWVWRIQRAMRAFLRRKWEARALAVAMGWHARLGGTLAVLPVELARAVVG